MPKSRVKTTQKTWKALRRAEGDNWLIEPGATSCGKRASWERFTHIAHGAKSVVQASSVDQPRSVEGHQSVEWIELDRKRIGDIYRMRFQGEACFSDLSISACFAFCTCESTAKESSHNPSCAWAFPVRAPVPAVCWLHEPSAIWEAFPRLVRFGVSASQARWFDVSVNNSGRGSPSWLKSSERLPTQLIT